MAVVRQTAGACQRKHDPADLDRRRETLEAFRWTRSRWLACMRRSGINVALVETSGGTHPGALGQLHGTELRTVTRVSETEIDLKEIVQDAAGEWVERSSKLELQDAPVVEQRWQTMRSVMKTMKWAVAAFATICSLALVPGRVAAQDAGNSIEKIEGVQTANGVLVTIQLKKPAAGVPASFSVANPARVAIDLPDTTSNLQRSVVELNQGDLRSINVVQAQGRTRVVLNLVKSGKYNVTTSGNNVLVALGGVADTTSFQAAAPAAPATPSAAASSAPSAAPGAQAAATAPAGRALRAIDFRRGKDGEGRVVVDLADPNTERRHPPAGPDGRRRLPVDVAAGDPAPPPRRHRFRHAGPDRQHDAAGRQRAHGHRAARARGNTTPTRATPASSSK